MASTFTGIAAVTFANGADNIGVFTPLFRSLHPSGAIVIARILCFGRRVVRPGRAGGHPHAVTATLGRISHWLLPVVFIAIGVLILITTRTATLITDMI